MRVLAWNLGHQTREREIKGPLVDVLRYVNADVVSFNEFVDGPTRASLHAALAALGYGPASLSNRHGTHNRVLIASLSPVGRGTLAGPSMNDAARSNFHHVTIPGLGVEVVGLRTPAYEKLSERREYWDELRPAIAATAGRRIVFIGDLNADPDVESPGGLALAALEADGWKIPRPAGAFSWRGSGGKTARIDHAVCSPLFGFAAANYLTTFHGQDLVGNGLDTVSDHAPLIVDIKHAL